MYNHYEIANLPDSDLRDIFLQVSSEMNLPPSVLYIFEGWFHIQFSRPVIVNCEKCVFCN